MRARGSGNVVALRESVRGFLRVVQGAGVDTMEEAKDGAGSPDYADFLSALEEELVHELAQELVLREEQDNAAAQVQTCLRMCMCTRVVVVRDSHSRTFTDPAVRRLITRSRSRRARRRRRHARSAAPQGLCGRATRRKWAGVCSARAD